MRSVAARLAGSAGSSAFSDRPRSRTPRTPRIQQISQIPRRSGPSRLPGAPHSPARPRSSCASWPRLPSTLGRVARSASFNPLCAMRRVRPSAAPWPSRFWRRGSAPRTIQGSSTSPQAGAPRSARHGSRKTPLPPPAAGAGRADTSSTTWWERSSGGRRPGGEWAWPWALMPASSRGAPRPSSCPGRSVQGPVHLSFACGPALPSTAEPAPRWTASSTLWRSWSPSSPATPAPSRLLSLSSPRFAASTRQALGSWPPWMVARSGSVASARRGWAAAALLSNPRDRRTPQRASRQWRGSRRLWRRAGVRSSPSRERALDPSCGRESCLSPSCWRSPGLQVTRSRTPARRSRSVLSVFLGPQARPSGGSTPSFCSPRKEALAPSSSRRYGAPAGLLGRAAAAARRRCRVGLCLCYRRRGSAHPAAWMAGDRAPRHRPPQRHRLGALSRAGSESRFLRMGRVPDGRR